jgi:murein L,D-transpeptidase YafK
MVRVLAGGVAMLPAPSATLCSSAKFSTLHDVTRPFGCLLSLLVLFAVSSTQPRVDLVIVKKKDHKLLLMNGDTVVKSYSVALARGGLGPKQREGDHKTPEGSYRVASRNQSSRFHRALHVSYPNEADKERAQKLGVDPGSDIMIHGIQNGLGWIGAAHRLIDWTNCLAVTDEEIEEIWTVVPDGTPIEIRP